jgi:hypothetical protein
MIEPGITCISLEIVALEEGWRNGSLEKDRWKKIGGKSCAAGTALIPAHRST